MIFVRGNHSEIGIKLTSNEELGVLDTAYIEDFFGTDGQVSLFHQNSSQRFDVLMTTVPDDTPGVANDVLLGFYPLNLLPDGNYEIQGFVRDTAGNYTVLSLTFTLINKTVGVAKARAFVRTETIAVPSIRTKAIPNQSVRTVATATLKKAA